MLLKLKIRNVIGIKKLNNQDKWYWYFFSLAVSSDKNDVIRIEQASISGLNRKYWCTLLIGCIQKVILRTYNELQYCLFYWKCTIKIGYVIIKCFSSFFFNERIKKLCPIDLAKTTTESFIGIAYDARSTSFMAGIETRASKSRRYYH